jgi:hypothetical protein
MSITYKFRSGWSPRGVSAQDAAVELARIHSERGSITPETVVDEARPASSPLHPVFEWNDLEAAEQHRQHQARNLIRAVHVVTDRGSQPVYAHVRVLPQYLPTVGAASADSEEDTHESTGGYLPVREIATDERLVRQAMGAMVAHLKAASKAAEEMAEAIWSNGAAAREWKMRIGQILEEAAATAS